MKYEISAEDLLALALLASHLDTEGEVVRVLMRVSESSMRAGTSASADDAPVPPAKPE